MLCIDDNVLGLAVRKALLETRDYRAFTAESGPAGLEIAVQEQIDLVILDYEMPEMDGGQVARQLRSLCPQVPILLLSGYPGRIPKALLAAVDGFVLKGSSPEILLKEIERIMNLAAKAAQPRLTLAANPRKRSRNLPGPLGRSTLPARCRRKRKR